MRKTSEKAKAAQTLENALGEERLQTLTAILGTALPDAHEAVSCRAADAIKEGFIYLHEHRDAESREIRLLHESTLQLCNCCIHALDRVGFGKAVEDIVPLFDGIRLSDHLGELRREQEMFSRAGMRAVHVQEFAQSLDDGLPDLIAGIRRGEFEFGCLTLPDDCGYLGPHEGNSWSLLRGVLGGAVLVADAVCTLPTAGVAGASIVAGVVGVGTAVAGVP